MPKDIYGPDVIHGSPAGFDAGCSTRPVCTNFGSADWLTCAEAIETYRSDFRLSKDPRTKPIGRGALQQPAPAARIPARSGSDNDYPPLGQHGPKPVREVAETSTFETPAPATSSAPVPKPPAERFVTPPAKPKRLPSGLAFDDPQFPHGTVGGYGRGCGKNGVVCPGNESGTTCNVAQKEYMREYDAKRYANRTAAPAKPRVKKPESVPELEPIESAPTTPEQAPDPGDAMEADTDSAPVETPTVQPSGLEATSAPELNETRTEATAAAITESLEQQLIDEALASVPIAEPVTPTFTDDQLQHAGVLLPDDEQAPASGAELEPTGGGTATVAIAEPTALEHGVDDLALTIEPTAAAGVRIGFSLPALGANTTLTIRVAFAATKEPGLGDLQIAVGSHNERA